MSNSFDDIPFFDEEPGEAPRKQQSPQAPAGRVPAAGGGIANANRLVAMSGFFGQRDANLTERFSTMGQHHGPPTLQQQIDTGSIVCGSPESVAAQLKRLNDSIGCGVVELSFSAPSSAAM